jgi:hypothetical protein
VSRRCRRIGRGRAARAAAAPRLSAHFGVRADTAPAGPISLARAAPAPTAAMQISRKSFSNLQALAKGDFGGSTSADLGGGGPLAHGPGGGASQASLDSNEKRTQR